MTKNIKMTKNIRWMLIFYDMGVYAIAAFLLLAFYAGDDKLSGKGIFEQAVISIICIFAARIIGNIYGQVWRYGGIQCYIRLLFTDFAGFLAYKNMTKNIKMTKNIRWMLIFYDMGVYAIAAFLLLAFYAGDDKLSGKGIFEQVVISIICIFAARIIGNIYGQVWRYGGIQCYIRLLFTDFAGFLAYLCLESILPIQHITFGRLLSLVSLNLLGALAIRMVYRYAYKCGNHDTYLCLESILPIQHITFGRLLSLVSLNLLGALAIRMVYRYAYKCGNHDTLKGKILLVLFRIFSGMEVGNDKDIQKIKIAIIGAGRVGVGLAEELLNNSEASYTPRCFIDVNKEKVGREIQGIPVWSEDEATLRVRG